MRITIEIIRLKFSSFKELLYKIFRMGRIK